MFSDWPFWGRLDLGRSVVRLKMIPDLKVEEVLFVVKKEEVFAKIALEMPIVIL